MVLMVIVAYLWLLASFPEPPNAVAMRGPITFTLSDNGL